MWENIHLFHDTGTSFGSVLVGGKSLPTEGGLNFWEQPKKPFFRASLMTKFGDQAGSRPYDLGSKLNKASL